MVIDNSPLVSIITPVHNTAQFLPETIESVLAQTCVDWELILVDDSSDDGSYDVAARYAATDPRIRLFRQPSGQSGGANTRNTAIGESEGRYVAFLDSDDTWLPTKLEAQLKDVTARNVVLSYGSYVKVDEDSHPISKPIVPPPFASRTDILKSCHIPMLTAMYDTHHFGKVHLPIIERAQDYALWLKLLKQCEFAHAFPGVLAKYRIRKGSLSANKLRKSLFQWRVYREIEELPFATSAHYFMHYALSGFAKWVK